MRRAHSGESSARNPTAAFFDAKPTQPQRAGRQGAVSPNETDFPRILPPAPQVSDVCEPRGKLGRLYTTRSFAKPTGVEEASTPRTAGRFLAWTRTRIRRRDALVKAYRLSPSGRHDIDNAVLVLRSPAGSPGTVVMLTSGRPPTPEGGAAVPPPVVASGGLSARPAVKVRFRRTMFHICPASPYVSPRPSCWLSAHTWEVLRSCLGLRGADRAAAFSDPEQVLATLGREAGLRRSVVVPA